MFRKEKNQGERNRTEVKVWGWESKVVENRATLPADVVNWRSLVKNQQEDWDKTSQCILSPSSIIHLKQSFYWQSLSKTFRIGGRIELNPVQRLTMSSPSSHWIHDVSQPSFLSIPPTQDSNLHNNNDDINILMTSDYYLRYLTQRQGQIAYIKGWIEIIFPKIFRFKFYDLRCFWRIKDGNLNYYNKIIQ